MTPQEAFAALMRELSASASTPLNASTEADPQDNLSLRQAIGQILWKEAALVDLRGDRPRHPAQVDDQLGHLLSLRVEVLQILALVADFCASQGRPVVKILNDVKESLK